MLHAGFEAALQSDSIFSTVIAGLDPAIYRLKKCFLVKIDGYAGQARV
jgi:hypothetical protein